MATSLPDPYDGAESEEERQVIYQKLLDEYEQAEYERRKAIYDDLMVDWKHHREIQLDIDNRRQRTVLNLAAGAFGVSFAFISQVVKIETAVNTLVMVLSWAFFAVTLVLALLELAIGSRIQDKLLDSVEDNIKRGYEGKPYSDLKKWQIMWPTRTIGWVSLITFAMGVGCLLYFVLTNVTGI